MRVLLIVVLISIVALEFKLEAQPIDSDPGIPLDFGPGMVARAKRVQIQDQARLILHYFSMKNVYMFR